MKRIGVSIDDVLILLILAVTMAHVADFLSYFEAHNLRWVSIPQAIAIDGAIARCGYLYRVYTGRRQRQWALIGVLFFSACSVVFNYGYYIRHGAQFVEGAALALLFPVAVALLAYLRGQRTVSESRRSQVYHRSSRSSRSLTKREVTIVRAFQEDPRTSLAQLGRELGISKTTAMRLVNRLIADGYPRREGQEVHILRPASRLQTFGR